MTNFSIEKLANAQVLPGQFYTRQTSVVRKNKIWVPHTIWVNTLQRKGIFFLPPRKVALRHSIEYLEESR